MKAVMERKNTINFSKPTLSITFESEKELEMFYAIFNYVPICEAFYEYTNGSFISGEMRRTLGNVRYTPAHTLLHDKWIKR